METQIIGKNIKSYREHLRLNQEHLAEFLGIKREVISYYENGVRPIPIDIIKKLSDFFGVEIIDLMEENVDLHKTNVAFAFRANDLKPKDFENISAFRKIAKNYLKLIKQTGK